MQVSDMRGLKALYSQRLRNNLSSHKPFSLISCHCNSPQNPKKLPYYRTIHSTSHRLNNESAWASHNAWDNISSDHHDAASTTEEKTNPRGVSAVYDPISGSLFTRRGGPQFGSEPESSSGSDEDADKERTYGSVIRRESVGGGSEKQGSRLGLGLGLGSSGGEEDADKERAYGSVIRRESVGGGSEKQGSRFGLGLGLGSGGGGYVNRKKGKGKDKVAWVCSSCGHSEGQWWGSCRSCSSVGTIVKFVEGAYDEGRTSGFEVSENVVRTWLPNQGTEMVPLRLTDVNRGVNQTEWRIPLPGPFGTEVARVLGGGLVPGCLVLVGGDPGVGKSTLALQIAAIIAEGHDFGKPAPVVYVSGEESVEQIGHRADRMTIETEELFLYSSTDIEDVFEKIQHLSPRALVVDSIQTVYLKGVTGSAGGLQQVKECTSALLRFAKRTSIPVLLIGHVNKAGDIAGPRVLEHIVDVVLYMEGEKHSSHRLLRSVKNRFGSTDELGVFEMSQLGLQAVSNPSEMFLTEQQPHSEVLAGLAVAAMMDGSRTFLIEIQALCVSGASNSRQVNGVQASRADMIISVLKKQAGLKLQDNGIYLNVVSGVMLSEPAGDLAVAAAICSSFLEFAIPNSVAFIGEIGLGGELRGVPRMEKRINTVAKLGYKKCIIPKSAEKSLAGLAIEGTTIVSCRNLKEMINTVFTRT